MKKLAFIKKTGICFLLIMGILIAGFGNVNVKKTDAAAKVLTGSYYWESKKYVTNYCTVYIQKKSGSKVKLAIWGWEMTDACPAKTLTVKNGKVRYKVKNATVSLDLTIRFQGKKLKCSGKVWGDKTSFTAKRNSSEKPDFSSLHLYF